MMMRTTNTSHKKKMKNKNKIYTPEDIVEWQHSTQSIIPYDKISLIRSLSGVSCIGIGIITTFIPFTTAPLIMLGSYLLGYDSKVLVPKGIYKLKCLSNWVYANRTPKKIRRTIKARLLIW